MRNEENNYIDITGLDKAELLAALYNNAKPRGLGFIHANASTMTKEKAKEYIAQKESNGWSLNFDYLEGRALKIDITKDKIFIKQYDNYNGDGLAKQTIEEVSKGNIVPSIELNPTNELEYAAFNFQKGNITEEALQNVMNKDEFSIKIETPDLGQDSNSSDEEGNITEALFQYNIVQILNLSGGSEDSSSDVE
jgi:hypothetical protein